jgi:hypothetical protein
MAVIDNSTTVMCEPYHDTLDDAANNLSLKLMTNSEAHYL